jgi:hypothetical protein
VGAAAVVVVGIATAATVVLVHRHAGPAARAATAAGSTAPQPSIGASLPVATPSAADTSSIAQFSDAASAGAVLAAAKTAVQTVDSYDYRHLAAAKAAGDRVATGAFLQRYDQSLSGAAAAAARSSKTVLQATVEKVGICSLSATQATVLTLGRLQSSDAAHPGGTTTPVTLGVTLRNEGGTWRIGEMADLGSTGSVPATPPGTIGLTAAVTAGARETVDLLSYTRNDFTADVARALAGLTGPLRTSQRAQANALLSAMTAGGFDYAGVVRAVGVESASGTSVLMLVCATGYRLGDSGKSLDSGPVRYEVGVSYTGGRWLVDEFVPLDPT